MLRLALKNLFQTPMRLVMSTGGLALALLLVLVLDAIFTGANSQVSAYMDRGGADVWVAQQGVRTMHMSGSAIPASDAELVRRVDGVASVTPILYLTSGFDAGGQSHIAYVIGLPRDARAGLPWNVTQGRAIPGPGEAVIDASVAEAAGIGLGSTVSILNTNFKVSGLTRGTLTIVNSIAFISLPDFMAIRGGTKVVSYLLVKAAAGRPPASVAQAIERAVPGVTATTSADFAAQERAAISTMSTDLVAIMNIVGLLIGLAVMALAVYTSTLARRAEYGVLKAVGARNGDLYRVVILQAAVSLGLALVLSIVLTLALGVVVPLLRPGLDLEMSFTSVVKVGVMAIVISTLAAALPVMQMAKLDPSEVFRRKVA